MKKESKKVMKKFFSTIATLAVVLFAGCTQDFTNGGEQPLGGSTLKLKLADSKTQLGELVDGSRKVYWVDGDQICADGNASTAIAVDDSNKGVATFSFAGNLDYPCNILYPYEMYKDATTITLPAVQAAAKGSFGSDAAPMAAVAEGTSTPLLKHLTATVRLRVKAASEEHTALRTVKFQGNNSEQVSGDFTIDYANATLTETSTAAADLVVAAKVNQTLTTESTIDVFVVVPAREYANGFTVTLLDENGHFMTKAKASAVTIAAGEIYAMPDLTFAPTGTQFDVEISSAAELIAFAKAFNAGEYADNSFIAGLTEDITFDAETSAEFESIGTADTYFYGRFDGNGKSINGLTSTKPLFGYTQTNAYIYNLTIGETSSFSFNCDEDGAMAALVGYHKGELTNCHCNADVTLVGEWNANTRAGGLAGRLVEGKIINCSMSGDLTLDATFLSTGSAYIGGVAGASTNTASVITNSHFSGNLSVLGGVTDASKEYFIGGVVGMLRGTCTECSSKYNEVAGSVTVSTLANNFTKAHIGGVAGMVDGGVFNNNTNYAAVKFNVTDTDYSEVRVGGVIGANRVSVSDLENNGLVVAYPNAKDILCHNIYIGGIIGVSEKGDYSPETIVIDETTNNGEVLFSGHKNTVDADDMLHNWITVGGIIGYDYTGVKNHTKNSINNGLVGVSFPAKENGRGTAVGGIVGLFYRGGSIIESCVNNGHILNHNFNNTNNKSNIGSGGGAFGGGIAGYAAGQNGTLITIKNCQSTCVAPPSSYSSYVHGGITAGVGVYGVRGHNGGLAGLATYVDLDSNTCSANVYQHQQGYSGGLVGWLASSTLQKCTFNGASFQTPSNTTVAEGGLVGYATTSTIKENIFNSAITGTKTTVATGGAGVLVGVSDAATTITDNKVKGTFYGAAITLDSTMVGSGTPTVSGTTLYTE